MTITFKKNTVTLSEVVSVDDAENLLQWVQAHPRGRVDLGGCTHLHSANLQVLMSGGLTVSVWPRDEDLKTWLESALKH